VTDDLAPAPTLFGEVLRSHDELRALYRAPTKLVAGKKMDRLPPWCRVMVETSRFLFVATADRDGRPTVSPKGGADGFVAVLDDQHLAIPDYPGNNLIDSLENIVDNPAIGLIFVTPGRNETLRVDGDAWVTTDADVLARCRGGERRRPKAAIGVRIRDAFFHCPSSFQRAGLWESAGWRSDAALEFDEFIRGSLPTADLPDWARGV
jgi:uncharacterized protein